MGYIHDYLCKKHSWYSAWHVGAHSSAVVWGLFIIASAFISWGLLSVIAVHVPAPDAYTQVSLASGALQKKEARTSEDPIIARLQSANNAALTQANEHALTAPGLQEAALAALKAALTSRQATLKELALTNPKEVRQFIFNAQAAGTIPEAAKNLIEKPFQKEGVYRIALVTDAYDEHQFEESHEEYFLVVSDTERYRLALSEEEAHDFEAESNVQIVGVILDGDIVVPTEFLEPGENSGDGEVLGASTIKKVAIVAFNFRNDASQPLSPDVLRSRVFTNADSVNAYYKEVSYGMWEFQGKTRVDGDVYGWVTLDVDGGNCDYNGWASAAGRKLAAEGVDLTGYTNIQYVFPGGSAGCGWAGLAYLGGTTSWVRGEYFNTFVSGHELGHNFGFHHAGSYGCAVATNALGVCNPSEYGDAHDIMGGSARHTNNYNKSKYWIQPGQIMTVANPGTYTLEPTETKTTGTKVIRIKRPFAVGGSIVSDGYYELEFRTPYGFDNYSPTDENVNGVTLRLVGGNYLAGAEKTYRVSVVGVGNTFTDAEGGVTIRTDRVDTTGASITIDMPPVPCVRYNPTVGVGYSNQWGTAGNSLTYTLFVKNNDTSGCGASTFTATPVLPADFAQSPAVPSLLVNPGEEKSIAITISAPITAAPASYSITEVVRNESSVQNTASALLIYNVAAPDVTAPTVNVFSPVGGAVLTDRRVNISAGAVDPSGISKIELYIDGKLMKTCTGVTTCAYAWNLGKVVSGTHTIKAVGIDNATQKNRAETITTVTK